MDPWRVRFAKRMGMDERESTTVARMVVAAGRAVLELWAAGELTRAEAVRDTARGISALLAAFASNPDGDRRRAAPSHGSRRGRSVN